MRGRAAAAVTVGALLVAGPVTAGSVTAAPRDNDRPAERPFSEARRAAERSSFSGEVLMRWRDEAGMHSNRVSVAAHRGVVLVRGGASVMARRYERLVRQANGSWDVLRPQGLGSLSAPSLAPKYSVVAGPGPEIAGRRTRAVEIRRHGVVRERLLLLESGLLVGREHYDERGQLQRSLTFDVLRTDAVPSVPAVRHRRQHHRADVERASGRAELAGSYRRLGSYRRGDVRQVVYSDGIYGLSVFEQPGRLRAADLPAGRRPVRVGSSPGWRFRWPGGHVVVWQAAGRVYTAVGDGTESELLTAAASLRPPAPTPFARLRAVCRSLLKGF